MTPFAIQIDAEVLSDLGERIHNSRWPDQAPGAAWEQGPKIEMERTAHGQNGAPPLNSAMSCSGRGTATLLPRC
jgi:hypothetical protein